MIERPNIFWKKIGCFGHSEGVRQTLTILLIFLLDIYLLNEDKTRIGKHHYHNKPNKTGLFLLYKLKKNLFGSKTKAKIF